METYLISERSRTYIFISFVLTFILLGMEQYGLITRNITYLSFIVWYFILALLQEIGALHFKRIGKVKISPESIEQIDKAGNVSTLNLTNKMHIIINDEPQIIKSYLKLYKIKHLYIFENEDQVLNRLIIVYKRKNNELESTIKTWKDKKLLIENTAT